MCADESVQSTTRGLDAAFEVMFVTPTPVAFVGVPVPLAVPVAEFALAASALGVNFLLSRKLDESHPVNTRSSPATTENCNAVCDFNSTPANTPSQGLIGFRVDFLKN